MPNVLSESQVKIWKVTGALSGILGFSCYAVSSWLEYLIGPLDTGKIVGYCVVAFVSCVFTLVVDKVKDIWPSVPWTIQFSKKLATFVSLILTNVFSAWEEHRGKGKEESSLLGKTMNVISGAAFAIMAISFSMILQLEFEVGMTNFMIGRFLIRSINVSRLFGMVAGLFCWVLIDLPDILAWVNNQLHRGGAVDAIPVSDFGNRGTASGSTQYTQPLGGQPRGDGDQSRDGASTGGGGAVDAIPAWDFGNRGTASGSTQDTQPLGGGDQSRGGASTVGGDGPERDDSENFSEPVEGQFFNKGGFHKRVTASGSTQYTQPLGGQPRGDGDQSRDGASTGGGGAVDAIPAWDFGNRGTASGSTQDTQPLGGGGQSPAGASTVGGDGDDHPIGPQRDHLKYNSDQGSDFSEHDDSENFPEPVEDQFFGKDGFRKRGTAADPIGESSQQDVSSDTHDSDSDFHEKVE